MKMRLRIPELLDERRMTAYALSRRSEGRISMSTAYRLSEKVGRLDTYGSDLLEALCDVFGVTPGDLFERDGEAA